MKVPVEESNEVYYRALIEQREGETAQTGSLNIVLRAGEHTDKVKLDFDFFQRKNRIPLHFITIQSDCSNRLVLRLRKENIQIGIRYLQALAEELLESLLDIGEAAVISHAREQKASLVLIDERKARKVARDIYGLQPIGTARILVEAKKKNLLPDIASQFQKLRQEGYWIHEGIVQAALREAGEI